MFFWYPWQCYIPIMTNDCLEFVIYHCDITMGVYYDFIPSLSPDIFHEWGSGMDHFTCHTLKHGMKMK